VLLVVKLDSSDRPCGPAIVAAIHPDESAVTEIFAAYTDRDGAVDPRIRLWRGDPAIKLGDRVSVAPPVIGRIA
jgi:hypothetical protein